MNDRLSRIVDRLTRAIPDPPAPLARPAASFATLRVGQRIREIDDGIGASLETNVVAVDSLGVWLSTGQRITDRNWKATWMRVRPPHKRKATP